MSRVLGVVAVFLGIGARAQLMPSEPLDPRTYASPSGAYKLYVNPSVPNGAGSGFHALSRNGKLIWKQRLPYTLTRAIVTDSGAVCGYSDPADFTLHGFLHIVVLSPKGRELLREQYRKHESQMVDAPPEPYVTRLAASAESDTFVLTLFGAAQQVKTYRIASGKRFLSPLSNRLAWTPGNRYIIGMRYVPGTKLLLVNWWDPTGDPGDAEFELLDPRGSAVWRFVRKGDYVISSKDQDPHDALGVQQTGAILGTSYRRFSIRLVQDDAKLSFAISGQSGTYSVRQPSKTSIRPPSSPATPSFPLRKLKQLSTFILAEPHSTPLPGVRNVSEFCNAGPHRFAYISGRSTLVLFSDTGRVVGRFPLPPSESRAWDHITYLGSSRFCLSVEGASITDGTELWLFDIAVSKSRKIAVLPKTMINAIAAAGNGRVVYCGSIWSRFSAADVVACIDSTGNEIWRVANDGGYGGAKSDLLSPESLTVAPDGSVALIDNVAHVVQVFDRSGKFVRSIELDQTLGRKLSYPTQILSTGSGFMIKDFGGSPPIWEVDSNGRALRQLSPTIAGRVPEWLFLVPNDGKLWISDTNDVYELDHAGRVLRALGEPAQPFRLRNISSLAITQDGSIFASDGRTGSIHCFTSDGRWRAVVRGPQNDGSPGLEVADSHRVLTTGVRGPRMIDAFGRTTAAPTQRGSRLGSPLRRPDGTWVRSEFTKAFASDGSEVILDTESRFGRASLLCFYSKALKPQGMAALPSGVGRVYEVGFDGTRVVLHSDLGLYCVDRRGRPLWRAPLQGARMFLARRTIYLLDHERSLLRFEMPR